MDGEGIKCRRNIAERFNRLSRAHERYRRQTDGRAIAYFTFAKNLQMMSEQSSQRNIDAWRVECRF